MVTHHANVCKQNIQARLGRGRVASSMDIFKSGAILSRQVKGKKVASSLRITTGAFRLHTGAFRLRET
jgi:hypothetical protein